MKKVLFILAMALPIICHAQCNEKTKEQLDSLKSSIPYPKFNIDEVLYIAFINDPNVGTINVTEKDINVKKVRIYNMSAYNSIEGSESSYVLSLRGTYPVEWQYQFIDTQIENPKYKDVSDFYSEDRFSTTAIGAKQILMKKD